jgi:hypothetical protein
MERTPRTSSKTKTRRSPKHSGSKTKRRPLPPRRFERFNVSGKDKSLFDNYQLYNLLTYIYRDFTDGNYEKFTKDKDHYLSIEFEYIDKKYIDAFKLLIKILESIRTKRIDNYIVKGTTQPNNLNNTEITNTQIREELEEYNYKNRDEAIRLRDMIENYIIPPSM